MGAAAKASADGHTILVVSSSFVINPSLYAKVPYDPVEDFAPVTVLATSPIMLVVNPSFPATNSINALMSSGVCTRAAVLCLELFMISRFRELTARLTACL